MEGMSSDTDSAGLSPFVLGVDLDGVCADYTTAFRNVVAAERGVDPETIGEQTHWEFEKSPSWGITTRDEFIAFHKAAVEDHRMFATMPAIDGASDALWHLSDLGVRIRIITHRFVFNWGHQIVAADTTQWLDDNKIPYRDICFCAAKAEVGADLYIDDAPHNVAALRQARRDVICFDAPYNRDVTGLRAANWNDVITIVEARLDDMGLR